MVLFSARDPSLRDLTHDIEGILQQLLVEQHQQLFLAKVLPAPTPTQPIRTHMLNAVPARTLVLDASNLRTQGLSHN